MNLVKDLCKISEITSELSSEKVVECEFIVPDYYPDILKIIHTEALPRIKTKHLIGDKYEVEGYVDFKVFYICEELKKLHCISYPQDFMVTYDTKLDTDNPLVMLKLCCDNTTSRALNQRKIAPRTTVSSAIKVYSEKNIETLAPIENDNIQQKRVDISALTIGSHGSKLMSVSEDIEVSSSSADIENLLKNDVRIQISDIKSLANKAVIHGVAIVKNVCSSVDNDIFEIESKLPFTQIVEIDNFDDSYDIDASYEVCDVLCNLKQNDNGESKIISADIVALCCIRTMSNQQIPLIEDAYSVSSGLDFDVRTIKYDKLNAITTDTFLDKEVIDTENNISKVLYVLPNLKIVSFTEENSRATANCELSVVVVFCDDNGEIGSFKKNVSKSIDLSVSNVSDNMKFEAVATMTNYSYNISDKSTVELRYEADIKCVSTTKNAIAVIYDLEENKEKETERVDISPVTIYFAKKGEHIWDIAKRYKASTKSINESNDISNDLLAVDKMLIIPKRKC